MKEDLKIASVFIGTIVGAGLASGQEILQFFSLYGIKGFYGIILCGIIYIFTSIIIIDMCFKLNYKSYKEIIFSTLGKKLGTVVDIFLTFFIFGSNVIMISGGGAMLNEYAGINKILGTLIMAALVFIIGIFSTRGLIAVNSLIVPLSTSAILILGVLVLYSLIPAHQISVTLNNLPVIRKNWLLSAVIYSSFNVMGAIGVLCPITAEIRSKKHFIRGCILGSIVLTIIASIISFSILLYSPNSFHAEIPNLFIAKQFGTVLPFFITAVIWLEMFSTEISDIYSLCKRMVYSFKIPYVTSVLIIILISIPFSCLGFSNLIRLLYPPFGAVSLVFVLGCILKYFSLNNQNLVIAKKR